MTTRHPIDWPIPPQALQSLGRNAHDHDVAQGKRNDAALDEIETDRGASLEHVRQALGWIERSALSRVKHGDVPHGEHSDDSSGL